MRHTKFLLDVPAGEVTHTSKAFQFAWDDGDSAPTCSKRRPSSPAAGGPRHKLLRQAGQHQAAAGSIAAAAGDEWKQAEGAGRQLVQPTGPTCAQHMQQRELQQAELLSLLREAGAAESLGR